MTLYAGDKLVIEGTLRGFTNPCIEAGMMHCRALLEFLGLCDKNGRLGNIGYSEYGVEQVRLFA
ncbi:MULTISPECIES: hypothetical protein [Bradyrhizobium]